MDAKRRRGEVAVGLTRVGIAGHGVGTRLATAAKLVVLADTTIAL